MPLSPAKHRRRHTPSRRPRLWSDCQETGDGSSRCRGKIEPDLFSLKHLKVEPPRCLMRCPPTKSHRAPSCPYVEQEQAGIAVSAGVDDSEPRSESGSHDADCAHLLAPLRCSIPGRNGVFYLLCACVLCGSTSSRFNRRERKERKEEGRGGIEPRITQITRMGTETD